MSFYVNLLKTTEKGLNPSHNAYNIALFPHWAPCTQTHQITYIQNLNEEDQGLHRLCSFAVQAVLNEYSHQLARFLQSRHPNSIFIPARGMVICKVPNADTLKIEVSKYDFEFFRQAIFGPSAIELTRTTSEQTPQPLALPPLKTARHSSAPAKAKVPAPVAAPAEELAPTRTASEQTAKLHALPLLPLIRRATASRVKIL